MTRVKLRSEALEDLKRLPSKRLRRVELEWLYRIEREPHLGQRLTWQRSTGDLSECRKIYFDKGDEPRRDNFVARTKPEQGAGYRIVYRLLPDDKLAEHAEVIAVGPKFGPGGSVYTMVARRLDK